MHNPLPQPTFQTAIKFYVHRKRRLSAKVFQQDLRTEPHLLATQGYPSHHLGLTCLSLLFLPYSREGTVVFLTRVREHSTGLFSELKPLLPEVMASLIALHV